MRTVFIALLLAGAAAPAAAQEATVEKRVGVLESEMRAVQRKVFPGGNIEPEIRAPDAAPPTGGVPATSALADLTARVDALEAQLATITGQAEENANRLHQLEESVTRLRGDTDIRLKVVEAAAAPPLAARAPAEEPAPAAAPNRTPASGGADVPASGDPAEDAYVTGYRLWDTKHYAEAAAALAAMVRKYPHHKRASYAQNLLGRAYLDEGKPATAAKAFLANYQNDPKGERAPDSLYYLGAALMQLKKSTEACKVYEELQDVYGSTMRDWVRQRLPKAREDAKCS